MSTLPGRSIDDGKANAVKLDFVAELNRCLDEAERGANAIAQGAAYLMSVDLRIGAEGAFKVGLNETQIEMVLRHFG